MKRRRNKRGGSLVTIMLVALVASLWIGAVMALVLPSYTRAGNSRCEIALRSAAESAVDWGVTQLNVNRAAVDDVSDDGNPGPVVTVPQTFLGDYGYNMTATVQVSNQRPPATSYIYDPGLDPANAATNGGINTNGWRVVTATATSGRYSRTVRVISKPSYATSPTFEFGAFGRAGVGVNGTGSTDSYDSTTSFASSLRSTGGNIGTNGIAALTGNAVVGGDVRVLSDPPGSTNEVVSGTANVQIRGTLTANGAIHTNGSGPDFSSTNVLGNMPDGTHASTPISTQQLNPPRQLPAAPVAPSGATDLGAVSVTGRSVLNLPPGDYIMSSLMVGGRGQINLTGTGPVRIFVQGTSASISIAGNGILNNGRPNNLQIYYNGTANTSIAGNGSLTGVIYAPNSNVSVTGNGGLYGAAVGNVVDISSTALHYDRSLANFNPVQSVDINRHQAISWTERK